MRAFVAILCAVFLSSCGPAADPEFAAHDGDLAAFLESAVLSPVPRTETSGPPPRLHTSWHSRVLTGKHKSGEYLADRQALQVATARTNYPPLASFLTQRLGDPTLPLDRKQGGKPELGWVLVNCGLSVRLLEVGDQCQVEAVTTPSRGQP
jgi:hypothetical protein